MTRKYRTIGSVDNYGKLKVYRAEIEEFLSRFKGRRIILNIEILEEEPSVAAKAYYYKVVVPAFVEALKEQGTRKTQEDVEYMLRSWSPVMLYEKLNEDGTAERRVKRVSEVSQTEFAEHIETLKQIAAEEFSMYIEEPNFK